MNYLGVDIGNSGLKVSTFSTDLSVLEKTKRISWRQSDQEVSLRKKGDVRYLPGDDAWGEELKGFVSEVVPVDSSVVWLVSSVRRDASQVLERFIAQFPGHDCRTVDYLQLPLQLNVERPEKVGIDRLLAALAACTVSQQRPLVVVQAGSAVTVDLVHDFSGTGDEIGVFSGGAILPGVPMMLRLLGTAADMLPELDADDLTELPNLPGNNTEQAMLCGAASSLIGGVCHLVGRYREAYDPELQVIISGGDGPRLAPYIPAPTAIEPHLVQRGLLELARMQWNREQNVD